MNALQEKLFQELRQTKTEIEQALKKKPKKDWLASMLREELSDINDAIEKMENGLYGRCEISGEFLSDDLLKMVPTIKSKRDTQYLESFYKKSILPSS